MARKRLIDTEELYFKAELVNLLNARGLHLYIRLWGIAEDWGGYEPKYADVALKMGALKFTAKETEKFIGLLLDSRKIVEYEACGRKVHWIVNFMEHQPLDNPAMPKLPLPEWINCEELEYKSGKKYAKYSIIPEKLPVGYQSATRNGVTNSNSNETKQNSNLQNFPFEELYLKYPNKAGKKDALRHFETSIKTEQDWQNIQTALKNYLMSERVSKGYVQNASTWFNNWRDWVDFKETLCPKCKGTGIFTSSTGYQCICTCPKGIGQNTGTIIRKPL